MLDYRKGRTAAPRAPAEFGKLGRPFRGFQIALFGIEAKQLDVARGDGLCQEQILKKARMPRHRRPLVIPARQLLDRRPELVDIVPTLDRLDDIDTPADYANIVRLFPRPKPTPKA